MHLHFRQQCANDANVVVVVVRGMVCVISCCGARLGYITTHGAPNSGPDKQGTLDDTPLHVSPRVVLSPYLLTAQKLCGGNYEKHTFTKVLLWHMLGAYFQPRGGPYQDGRRVIVFTWVGWVPAPLHFEATGKALRSQDIAAS